MSTVSRWWFVAVMGVLELASASEAQQRRRVPPYAEFRADGIFGHGGAAQAGAGIVFPLGVYTRLSVDGAAGPLWHDDAVHASGRVDVIARFLLDPLRETRYGLSVGGGITLPYADGDKRVGTFLTAVIDLERRMSRGVTPALQIGLGGGTRIGVVLRRSPRAYR